jgi:hypothetical protein
MNFEVHCVKIESLSGNAVVKGKVSGGGFSVGGTGASRASGKTQTIHTSHITANGRLYEFRESNTRYPFQEDEDMVFLCRKDKGTGKYIIESLINNTNGTRDIKSPLTALVLVIGISVLVTAGLALFVLYFALPVLLFSLYYAFMVHPKFSRATKALRALEGKRDRRSMEDVLKRYSVDYVISGYE